MNARTILLYLFGHAGAVRAVAESRAAFLTGLVLVLITTIPRNYDQTFIGENPFRWLLGSLAFSLVSGTWLYGVAYGWLARWRTEAEEVQHHSFASGYFSGWRCFMGLFWMTAPIAWLYALPVERFLDSVIATKVNVGLLAIVSLWRVLLMARVFQVLCNVNFFIALVWVLLPAGIETCGVTFGSGVFGKALMSAMGGMRNSPEEDIILAAFNVAMSASLYGTPVALVLALVLKPAGTKALPVPQAGRVPKALLAGLAAGWLVVAIVPQREVARTVSANRLVQQGRYREALDYMAAHQPGDFAPAVPLSPKAFEREGFEQIPSCVAALQTSDPAWSRQHLFRRLDEMVTNFLPRRATKDKRADMSNVSHQIGRLSWWGADAANFKILLNGLERLPEGQAWLRTNDLFVAGLRLAADEPTIRNGSNVSATEAQQHADWKEIAGIIDRIRGTATNAPAPPRP